MTTDHTSSISKSARRLQKALRGGRMQDLREIVQWAEIRNPEYVAKILPPDHWVWGGTIAPEIGELLLCLVLRTRSDLDGCPATARTLMLQTLIWNVRTEGGRGAQHFAFVQAIAEFAIRSPNRFNPKQSKVLIDALALERHMFNQDLRKHPCFQAIHQAVARILPVEDALIQYEKQLDSQHSSLHDCGPLFALYGPDIFQDICRIIERKRAVLLSDWFSPDEQRFCDFLVRGSAHERLAFQAQIDSSRWPNMLCFDIYDDLRSLMI